ncbi:MAG: hypothetical protein PHX65_07215, partial [Sulfurimonas sp.]|nr:hypothetical protein [Sulfurimonas sp.]
KFMAWRGFLDARNFYKTLQKHGTSRHTIYNRTNDCITSEGNNVNKHRVSSTCQEYFASIKKHFCTTTCQDNLWHVVEKKNHWKF